MMTQARDLSGTSCVGYIRVSTDRQAGEKLTSLDDQKRAIEALAKKLGLTVDEWFVDAGASGGTMEGRPAMRELIASCEAHRRPLGSTKYVLARDASRWGRFDDPEEAPYWRTHFKRLGWTVRFAEGDDSEDPTARTLMRAIGDTQASAYRQAIKANARRGARGAASQGYWRGRAPFGYRRQVVHPAGRERMLENGTPKSPDEKVVLLLHDEEAAVVRWMFENYASGAHSLFTLSDELRQSHPRIKWCPSIVGGILRNPAYVGDVVGGRRWGGGRPGNGRLRPQAHWYGKQDAHAPIVSRELFAAVEARLAENAKRRTGVRSDYLVSGLVRCETCGRPLVGGGLGGRRQRGRRPHFYKCRCVNLNPRGDCPGKLTTVTQHVLEDAVLSVIGKELTRPAVQRAIAQAIDEAIAAEQRPHANARQLERAHADAVKRRDRIVEAVGNGTITEDEAASQLAAVREQIASLDTARQRARFEKRSASLADVRDAVLQMALDFPKMAQQLSGPALRELIKPWLADATFDKWTRYLTMHIRRVPSIVTDIAGFPSSASPGMTGRKQRRSDVITRRVRIGGTQRNALGRFA